MISSKAVDEFLDRELDEWDWLKGVSKEDIEDKIREYWPDVTYKTFQPFEHQLVGILLGILFKGFCYFLDMGGGKTMISLNVLRYRRKHENLGKVLVVVPNEASIESWKKEIGLFSDFSHVALVGTKAERLELLEQKADIYLINYGGLQVFMAEKKEVKKRGKAATNKMVLNKKASAEFASRFDAVVFDEIHHCKNRNSLQYEFAAFISDKCSVSYGLTGTPFGRNPMDLWAEFYLCDKGETLGQTVGMFQQSFFIKKPNFAGFMDWVFNERKKSKLQRVIKHRSIRYEDKECNDLPGSTRIILPLSVPKSSLEYYDQIRKEYLDRSKTALEKENVFIKMRQLSSGFIHMVDKELGIDTYIDLPENPKIDMLDEMLDDLPEDKKIIIFHEFNKSGEYVEALLKRKKIPHVALNSRTKDKVTALKKFQDPDDKCRVLVSNSKSGGTGLNLQIAKYMFFFESPVSPIVRKQAEKRSDRTGQTERVYIYDLLVKGSIEERIAEFIQEGKDLFDALLKGEFQLF